MPLFLNNVQFCVIKQLTSSTCAILKSFLSVARRILHDTKGVNAPWKTKHYFYLELFEMKENNSKISSKFSILAGSDSKVKRNYLEKCKVYSGSY